MSNDRIGRVDFACDDDWRLIEIRPMGQGYVISKRA